MASAKVGKMSGEENFSILYRFENLVKLRKYLYIFIRIIK